LCVSVVFKIYTVKCYEILKIFFPHENMLSVLGNFPHICVIEVNLQYPSRSTKMQGQNLLNMNMLPGAISEGFFRLSGVFKGF
jgi:hypothetical protein